MYHYPPQWFSTLEELKLNKCMMPRDVTTRWNSTYDMLEFAVKYRSALDSITGNRDMKLREYELSGEEWNIVKHLRDVLKVSFLFYSLIILLYHSSSRFSKMQLFFFTKHCEHCDGHSSDGPHQRPSHNGS